MEKIIYESSDFPFVMFTINEKECIPQGPGYQYLHWHEDLQFTVVTRGSVSIKVNGVNYNLKTNDAIFINSGLLHMTNHIKGGGEYISFNFPTRLLSFIYGSRLETDYVLHFTMNYSLPAILLSDEVPWQKKLIKMLLNLKKIYESKEVYAREYEISSYLTYIWLQFIRNVKGISHSSSKTFIRKQEYMQMMLAFIHNNYMNKVSLLEIADSVHISKGECCRLFKKTLNISPYEYLIKYRINKSIDLLKETNLLITEIATSVGFDDSSYYIKLFKKYTKETPKSYRSHNK